MIQLIVEILLSLGLFSLVLTLSRKQDTIPLSLNRPQGSKYDLYQLNQQYDKKSLFFDSSRHSLHSFGDFITNRILFHIKSSLEYDYSDVRYPIDFSAYYHHIENRYERYGEVNEFLPSFVKTGRIRTSNGTMLVIGSDKKQFYPLLATIKSALNQISLDALTVIDYGFSEDNLVDFAQFISQIHKNHSTMKVYYRRFAFQNAPTWISLSECATKGGYAWKVIGYVDASFQWKGMVLWIDTGVILPPSLKKDEEYAMKEGIYSPFSFDSIGRWTHPTTIRFLEENGMVNKVKVNETNCLSAYVIVNMRNKTIVNEVLMRYYQCAFTKKCIRPEGVNRFNHRYEQSILSILIKEVNPPHSATRLSSKKPPYRQFRRSVKSLEDVM